MDSDHLPLEVELRMSDKADDEEKEAEEKEEAREMEVIIWNKEAIKKYQEQTEVWSGMKLQKGKIQVR